METGLFTGKVCTKCKMWMTFELYRVCKRGKQGHVSYCKECERKATVAYRKRTPNADSYELHKAWLTANKDRVITQVRAWRFKNKERIQEAKARYEAKNVEARKARQKRVYAKSPESYKERASRRRNKLKENLEGAVDYKAILKRDGLFCYLCDQPITTGKIHFDHVIPISKDGPHSEVNIKVSHAFCNLSKKDKPVDEWREWFKKRHPDKMKLSIVGEREGN